MNKHKQIKKLGADASLYFDDAKKKKPEKPGLESMPD